MSKICSIIWLFRLSVAPGGAARAAYRFILTLRDGVSEQMLAPGSPASTGTVALSLAAMASFLFAIAFVFPTYCALSCASVNTISDIDKVGSA